MIDREPVLKFLRKSDKSSIGAEDITFKQMRAKGCHGREKRNHYGVSLCE